MNTGTPAVHRTGEFSLESGQQAFLRRRALVLLFESASWGLVTIAHIAVASALAWILTPSGGWQLPTAWAVVLALVVIVQATYASHYQTRDLSDAQVTIHLRRFLGSALVVGALWAFAGWFLYPPFNEELRLFLVFVMGGMSLSAVGTQHVHLPVCIASMSFAVPVLALRYALDGHTIEPILLVLYTAILIRLARMLSRFSLQATKLQYERDLLLQQLTARAQEMENARSEAEEANQAKSRFLAQASHDLRQPLHAIGLFVETLSNDNLNPRIDKIVERVQLSLSALSKLFDSLLDVTQLDTRKINRSNRNFALQELFQQLEQDFAPVAKEQLVDLRFVKTSCAVHTDPLLFARLLQNLISNAVRYAPGARVLIGVRRHSDTLSVQVVDSGPGIAVADQARIFQEFVRLESQNQLMSPGLGLGLSIVQRLARILSLRINLVSTPGRGTCFSVDDLSIATGSVVTLHDDRKTTTTTNALNGARVCVIDDDEEVLEATGRLLQQWGCEVQTHTRLMADWQDVDVVVSDIELADGVNGLEYFSETTREFELVLISGNTAAELRAQAAQIHVPLLHKPVRPVQLRSALLHVLTRNTPPASEA